MSSTPGTLSAALAFVPQWWQETADPAALDGLLVAWSRACGWRACGFVWPGENSAGVVRTVQGGFLTEVPAPPEVPDAVRRIRAGEGTVLYSVPNSTGRVFAGVQPPGRPLGLVWAERVAGQPWTEADRAYLTLTARTMERSPAVAAVVGPVIDPDRLYQRLGDAAVIAGRMAHDFDNILTGIIGFSDLTLPMLPPGSQGANFVSEIGKVGQRGIQFTQQLHQLSRSGQVKPNPAAVAAAVAKEEIRLKPAGGPNVRFERELAAGLPAVALEAGPLQVVIGHLMENAVEACPHGGLVRVTGRAVELSEADARGYLGKPGVGAHLLLTVSDTGTGIKPEVRRRLFVEPFYTTKVRHRGLGLAIAYRILCAHRGGIQLDAVPPPGSGTQVRVVLPLAAARPPAAAGAPGGHPAAAGNVSTTAVGG
jgi:signal transduction histidine kinase